MAITTAKTSAGILIYRRKGETVEVLLAHPGGPFWAHRDEGIWSIPKGEFSAGEETPIEAARREFAEETALVLCANGVHVFLFDALRPVPILSYAVRHLHARGIKVGLRFTRINIGLNIRI